MIDLELSQPVAMIRIRREEKLNVINREMLRELLSAVESIENKGVRSAIITGSGKSFIAGADIREMKDMTAEEAEHFSAMGHRLIKRMQSSSIFYIAAVNGYTFGGGIEMMLACDAVLASKNAVFAQSESNLGIIPGWGGTRNLPERVGKHRALKLMLTGEQISAEEALRIGLVDEICSDEHELMQRALELGKRIAEKSPLVVRRIKECVYDKPDFTLEQKNFSLCFSTEDQKEGMQAFLEKRKPEFKGR
jgi:enoyl-CoA hydratase